MGLTVISIVASMVERPLRLCRGKIRSKKREIHKSGGNVTPFISIFGASSRSRNRAVETITLCRVHQLQQRIQKHRSLVWVDACALSSWRRVTNFYEICSNTSATCFIKNTYGYGVGAIGNAQVTDTGEGHSPNGSYRGTKQSVDIGPTNSDIDADEKVAGWLEKGGVLGIPHMLPNDLSRTAVRLVCFGASKCPLSDAGAYISEAISKLILRSSEWMECSKLSTLRSDGAAAKTGKAAGCRAVGSKRLLSVTVRDDGTFHCAFEDTTCLEMTTTVSAPMSVLFQ